MDARLDAISIDPEVMDGTPVFAGTKVPIHTLFDWMEMYTLDYFLENFPSVKKEQALEVLQAAFDMLLAERMAEA